MKITFSKTPSTFVATEGVIAVFVTKGDVAAMTPGAAGIDSATAGALTRAMAAARFKGEAGQAFTLWAPAGLAATRIIALGLGEAAKVDELAAEKAGGALMAALNGCTETDATIVASAPAKAKLGSDALAARAAIGARLRSYRFDAYLTKLKPEDRPALKSLDVAVDGKAAAKTAFASLDAIADGVFFTRDLVNEPGNILHPEEFAKRLKKLSKLGVKVEVLGEAELTKLGMGSLLGVGQGSVRETQLVVMQWKGADDAKAQPIAFVGKGVCFDTGGISLKLGPGMEEMTMDMGGAGVVSGLMMALAGRKAKANVVGIVGLVENMPDGNAQRPGDIVTSMSGQTIEILNTDAEGRLVLADALWYCQDRFKPKFMIDLATLTGAIIIALGGEHAGLFANDDDLADRLAKAGVAVDEKLWRLPLAEAYDKKLKSRLADMQNIGGREAGSITAAQFLKRFVNDVPWAHLDIAGVTLSKEEKATTPKGGTGFGVRLLDRLVADNYEG